jgi:thymidine kinase
MNIQMKNRVIELNIGPMFAGKSSALQTLVRRLNVLDKNKVQPLIINHSIDIRYGENVISSHDQITIPCLSIPKMVDIINIENKQTLYMIKGTTDIIIDEAQFFDDLYDFITNDDIFNNKINIYLFGLNGTSERKPFENISKILGLVTKINYLTAYCHFCCDGTEANYSLRTSNEKDTIVVGSDNYKPVCESCYIKNKI